MSEDFDDGAASQPLGFVAGSPPIHTPEELVRDRRRVREMQDADVGRKTPAITPEELAAWRQHMRSLPPEPPAKKKHTRVDTAWSKPQQWNDPRRDG